jgi:GxxExxY protein
MTQISQMNDQKDPQTYAILGAAFEVHQRLGPGFLEAVYQEAPAIELAHCAVVFAREVPLPITYREQVLACAYRADFICYARSSWS